MRLKPYKIRFTRFVIEDLKLGILEIYFLLFNYVTLRQFKSKISIRKSAISNTRTNRFNRLFNSKSKML